LLVKNYSDACEFVSYVETTDGRFLSGRTLLSHFLQHSGAKMVTSGADITDDPASPHPHASITPHPQRHAAAAAAAGWLARYRLVPVVV